MSEVASTFFRIQTPGEAISAVQMAVPTVSINGNHTVGLHENGTVYAVGYDYSGSVSNVAGLTNKLQVAAGNYATVIQNQDKTLTGYGYSGAFGSQTVLDGWGAPDVKQMAGGASWFAILLEDGTVKSTNSGMSTAGWSGVVAICGGDHHLLALKDDGTVYSAVSSGQTPNGDVASVVSSWTDITLLETSNYITFGMKSDGTFVKNTSSSQTIPAGWNTYNDVTDIACSALQLFICRQDGTVEAAGTDSDGVFAAVATWEHVASLSVGSENAAVFGLRPDGTVLSCGNNSYGTVDTQSWDLIAGDNLSSGDVQDVFFGETVAHAVAFGTPILPVLQPVASPYVANSVIHTPTFALPTSASTFTHQSSFGLPVVGFISEALTRNHTHVTGMAVPSGWVETFSQPREFSTAEQVITKVTGLTFSQLREFPAALCFESREVFAGSLSHCILEDATGQQLAPLSIDIQYSGRNSTVHMVVSLPFAAGKAFISGVVLPLFVKANGVSVFKVEEFETSEYIGGSSRSYLLTVESFAVVRLPSEITTHSPTRVSALARSLSMDIPDAFDIIPGDILTAGSQPPFVVTAASIHIKDNESRSVVYG